MAAKEETEDLYAVARGYRLAFPALMKLAWRLSGFYSVDPQLLNESRWPADRLPPLLRAYQEQGGAVLVEIQQTQAREKTQEVAAEIRRLEAAERDRQELAETQKRLEALQQRVLLASPPPRQEIKEIKVNRRFDLDA